MATHDSSVPADSEKGYNTEGANSGPNKRGATLKIVDSVLRFLTFACTLSAFVVMISNRQNSRVTTYVISPKTFPRLVTVMRWAKYFYSDAFMWFVVANGVAFGYTLLSLLFSCFNRSPMIARFILLLDLLVAYMIMSGASAATAIAYIGKNGLSETGWSAICSNYHRYCAHVVGALVASFLGWLFLTLAIIIGLHRKS